MTTALRILNPIVSRIFGPPVDVDDVQARHEQQEHEQQDGHRRSGAEVPRQERGVVDVEGDEVLCGSETISKAYTAKTSEDLLRSEERRVGKECRSRWSPYH